MRGKRVRLRKTTSGYDGRTSAEGDISIRRTHGRCDEGRREEGRSDEMLCEHAGQHAATRGTRRVRGEPGRRGPVHGELERV